MNVQSIELMGPGYILMLGIWWGVAMILAFVVLTVKRAYITWRQRRETSRTGAAVAGSRIDA